MLKTKVKKEKVIKEFREELINKNVTNREIFDKPFFEILNHVYKYNPKETKCHLTRLGSMTFLVIVDHTYMYLEWSPKKDVPTLLSITVMDGEFDDGGIYHLSLSEVLEKMDEQWKTKDQ